MEIKKLDDIIRFTLGKNPTRIKDQELYIYSPENFENEPVLHKRA